MGDILAVQHSALVVSPDTNAQWDFFSKADTTLPSVGAQTYEFVCIGMVPCRGLVSVRLYDSDMVLLREKSYAASKQQNPWQGAGKVVLTSNNGAAGVDTATEDSHPTGITCVAWKVDAAMEGGFIEIEYGGKFDLNVSSQSNIGSTCNGFSRGSGHWWVRVPFTVTAA